MPDLKSIEDTFIAEWAVLGSNWGISKTMAMIQALLMISDEPLSTDDIMNRLAISRGNAHGGIKDLSGWGLVHKVHRRGERKEFFETEKDPMKIFLIVARERRRREIVPLLDVLHEVEGDAKRIRGADADRFVDQVKRLRQFTELGDSALERISRSEKSWLKSWLSRLVSKRKG